MSTYRGVILRNENRVCKCGHLWLHHATPWFGAEKGKAGKCEHYACKRSSRRSWCPAFRDTGYQFEREEMIWDRGFNGLVPANPSFIFGSKLGQSGDTT